jgi:hypothetical protein
MAHHRRVDRLRERQLLVRGGVPREGDQALRGVVAHDGERLALHLVQLRLDGAEGGELRDRRQRLEHRLGAHGNDPSTTFKVVIGQCPQVAPPLYERGVAFTRKQLGTLKIYHKMGA